MNAGEYIKQLRISKGLTQEELGAKVGVKRAAVQKWECGRTQNLKRSTIQKLAEFFDVSPASFVADDIVSNPKVRLISPKIADNYVTFPVVGEIAAGYDSLVLEDWNGETVDIPSSYFKGRDKSEFFVLEVKGDSMYPEYQEGDRVLILKQSTLEYSGQIGAVLYEDTHSTLKKVEYAQGQDWLKLVPINPNFKPQRIEGEALEHCKVIGIPRMLIREINN